MRVDVETTPKQVCANIIVLLDGQRRNHVVAADDEECWVDQYLTDANGRCRVIPEIPGRPAYLPRERRFGRVELRWAGDPELAAQFGCSHLPLADRTTGALVATAAPLSTPRPQ